MRLQLEKFGECRVSFHYQVVSVVVLLRAPSMGQKDLFKNYLNSIGLCAKNFLRNNYMKIEWDSIISKHKIIQGDIKINQPSLLCNDSLTFFLFFFFFLYRSLYIYFFIFFSFFFPQLTIFLGFFLFIYVLFLSFPVTGGCISFHISLEFSFSYY